MPETTSQLLGLVAKQISVTCIIGIWRVFLGTTATSQRCSPPRLHGHGNIARELLCTLPV